MENTVKERIKLFLKHLGVGQNSFESNVGWSNGYINNTKNISADKLLSVINEYPQLDIAWLLTGEGDMIKQDDVLRVHNPPYPESINENVVVPLYDIEAAANLTMTMNSEKENVIAYISLPNMPTVDGAVAVRGDSMYPIIKSGDIVVFKWVSSPEYITYGEMYLISYMWDNDKHVTVKYVKRSQQPGYITLVSYNTHHEPIDIPVDCIQSIALVKVSIRYNTIS